MSAIRRGFVDSPLHGGKCPRWLFQRMQRLGGLIIEAIVEFFGAEEFLRRISDPLFFQSLGCLLGFDWHSSGVTTTLCGALKEGIRGREQELGIFICGGKGATSRKTPQEIQAYGERCSFSFADQLVYLSKMTAKIDSAALQDGYQLYHHVFFFTSSGSWAVVQQGMNEALRLARRYHWLSETVKDLVCEPHRGICAQRRESRVLNLVARESENCRKGMVQLIEQNGKALIGEVHKVLHFALPSRHHIEEGDFDLSRISKTLYNLCAEKPADFEGLLATPGVGPKTLRALALTSEVVLGAPPSFKDPVSFSFAHGGKDGIPYPVDRKTYQESITFLEELLRRVRTTPQEKNKMYKQLKLLSGW
ncbi:DUF763 domain-containing protein [Atrimonas thermophila]|uniref:DUF763 domain-containing protein n=1 Tax=Atrimonas thermophila TaxID=3064161 RepID=UPI00399D2166